MRAISGMLHRLVRSCKSPLPKLLQPRQARRARMHRLPRRRKVRTVQGSPIGKNQPMLIRAGKIPAANRLGSNQPLNRQQANLAQGSQPGSNPPLLNSRLVSRTGNNLLRKANRVPVSRHGKSPRPQVRRPPVSQTGNNQDSLSGNNRLRKPVLPISNKDRLNLGSLNGRIHLSLNKRLPVASVNLNGKTPHSRLPRNRPKRLVSRNGKIRLAERRARQPFKVALRRTLLQLWAI